MTIREQELALETIGRHHILACYGKTHTERADNFIARNVVAHLYHQFIMVASPPDPEQPAEG